MFPPPEVVAERRRQFPEGARVRAVHFVLDEGLRIWPVQSGPYNGKWRLVRVTGQQFEELSEAPFEDFHVLQHAHPDATPGINDNESVPSGTEGTVRYVDDAGGVKVLWDNGRSIGANPGDTIELVQ